MTKVLYECTASEKHVLLKIQALLKSSKTSEALSYAKSLLDVPLFNQNPTILSWVARCLAYTNQEAQARTLVRQALD